MTRGAVAGLCQKQLNIQKCVAQNLMDSPLILIKADAGTQKCILTSVVNVTRIQQQVELLLNQSNLWPTNIEVFLKSCSKGLYPPAQLVSARLA